MHPILERKSSSGVHIATDINVAVNQGFNSFLVRGLDGILIEVVEEKPPPEGIWPIDYK